MYGSVTGGLHCDLFVHVGACVTTRLCCNWCSTMVSSSAVPRRVWAVICNSELVLDLLCVFMAMSCRHVWVSLASPTLLHDSWCLPHPNKPASHQQDSWHIRIWVKSCMAYFRLKLIKQSRCTGKCCNSRFPTCCQHWQCPQASPTCAACTTHCHVVEHPSRSRANPVQRLHSPVLILCRSPVRVCW